MKHSAQATSAAADYAQALNKAVAEELVEQREHITRISQRELIEKSGLSKSTIIRIEGAKVDIGTRDIALITDVLGVEPSEIMQRAQARVAEAS